MALHKVFSFTMQENSLLLVETQEESLEDCPVFATALKPYPHSQVISTLVHVMEVANPKFEERAAECLAEICKLLSTPPRQGKK